ncbi:MAG: glycosyltransferase [Chloroflexi bacterium]|nr:glycosyltransferase [Chloroflexota bacterium]
MKVLFLSSWFPSPPDNGSKLRVYHLLRALAARHQVSLASFAFGTARPQEADLRAWCRRVEVVQQDPSQRSRLMRGLRYLSLSPIVAAPVPAMSDAVSALAAETKFDVVVASTETMATYVSRVRGAAAILEEHNSFARMMYERYQQQTSSLQRLRCWASWQKTRYYEARLFPRFDLVTMVSEQDRQTSQALPAYRGKVEVVPNGVDCRRNRPGLVVAQPNALVYNGALTYSANYDAMRYFLSEIYPLIRQQIPDVSLSITGSTKGVDLAGLRLDESVRLTGYVDDIRLPVAGSAVCVVPLRQGGGTRLKILEAMALGTPVVATSKGVEGLEAVDGEHLLIADEPQSFAERTVRQLRDDALRQRLISNARRLVEERYDWERIGQRFVDLVEEVVHRNAGGSP